MLRFSVNVPPLAQDAKVEKDVKEETLSDLSETETDSEERWSLFSFVALWWLLPFFARWTIFVQTEIFK